MKRDDQMIDPINRDLVRLNHSLKSEKAELYNRWRDIQAKCSHPNIGEYEMYGCPDCLVVWDTSNLSSREYAQYSENIKKLQNSNGELPAFYSRDEIKALVLSIKSNIRNLEQHYGEQIKTLEARQEKIISDRSKKCPHLNKSNNYCPDCKTSFLTDDSYF